MKITSDDRNEEDYAYQTVESESMGIGMKFTLGWLRLNCAASPKHS